MKKIDKILMNDSDKVTIKKISVKKKLLNRFWQIVLSLVSSVLIIGAGGAPAIAIDLTDAAKEIMASEGRKEVINEALKVAQSKPALSLAAGITCIACIPATGAAKSPGLCVACNILIAKVIG